MLHTLPFLVPNMNVALNLAYLVAACELLAIAFIRYRFMGGRRLNTIVQVVIGGALVFAIGVWLGRIGAGYRSTGSPLLRRESISRALNDCPRRFRNDTRQYSCSALISALC